MRVVVLDFETYWDSKNSYSLSTMGPIEYIRDKRFTPQCFAFRVDHGNTMCVECIDGNDTKVLKALGLDRPDTVTVGHNINGFDGLVLSEYYGIRPSFIIDTISLMNWLGLSRVMSCSHKSLTATLNHGIKRPGTVVSDGKVTKDVFTPEEWEDFKKYCCEDTLQCSENFFSLIKEVNNPDALKLMSITAKMATEPSFIPDGQLLSDYVNKLDSATEASRLELAKFLHFENSDAMLKAIRSRKIFPTLLESLGCKCPMKFSEKQGKDTPAISKTDLEFTKLLQHPDERVRTLVKTRLENNSSIQKSRSESLLTFRDKPIPIMLGVFKAHTGRYTAGNEGKSDGLNFQNLSKRDPSKLAIREAIKAPKGYKVVACDSSQIEARILAWVSGQNDLVEQFRTGRDPYAEMASKIFGQTAKEIHDGAKLGTHPQHDLLKRERNVGKTCILSCLSADTEVLTDTGWKPIIKVSLNDKLWDGEQWVNHTGLSYNGMKKTIELDGLRLTADHLIWNGTTWNAASKFIAEQKYLASAVQYATERLPMYALSINQIVNMQNFYSDATSADMSNGMTHTEFLIYRQTVALNAYLVMLSTYLSSDVSILTLKSGVNSESLQSWIMRFVMHVQDMVNLVKNVLLRYSAAAELNPIGYCSLTYAAERQQDATYVQRRKPMPHALKNITLCETSCQMMKQDADLWGVSIHATKDATVKHIKCINIMVDVVSRLSSKISTSLCSILSHCQGMTILTKHLIVSTIMETMRKVISGLLHSLTKPVINAQSTICNRSLMNYASRLQNSKQSLPNTDVEPVYDLLNAGPNHRFTVRTKHGALIVHNCGYGVSSQKFSDTLLRSGIRLDHDLDRHSIMARHAHQVYRTTNSAIKGFWKYTDQVIRCLASNTALGEYGKFGAHCEFSYGRAYVPCTDRVCAYLGLPNGYRLWYPNLRFSGEQMMYDRITHGVATPTRIYGAGGTENLCQSYAFMMLGWQACRMADAGINIKANIHDAWITVVPEEKAEETKRTMETIMSSVPEWLEGFPVGCEAEIGDDFRIA